MQTLPCCFVSQMEKEEAEHASKAKTEFLAMISHELRTPLHGICFSCLVRERAMRCADIRSEHLFCDWSVGIALNSRWIPPLSCFFFRCPTGMLGFAELLEDSNLDDQQRSYLRTMQESASSLMSVINDLLDFSKAESGKMRLEMLDFELLNTVQSSMANVQTQASEKHIKLSLMIADDLRECWLNGDPLRIRQILTNLLSNAVKFTADGSVCLTVKGTLVCEAGVDHFLSPISIYVRATFIR